MERKNKFRTIGILGGMGPEATASLYLEIIKIFQKRFQAKYDDDFPPFFIYSLPIPDVVEKQVDEEMLVKLLQEGAKQVEKSGADFMVIACNTVQKYLPQIREAVKVEVLSIPEETVILAKRKNYKKVGLLATESTVKSQIYEKESKLLGLEIIYPNKNQRKEITSVIMNILSGNKSLSDKVKLTEICLDLQKNGAEAIILGCTDLPLILQQEDCKLELLDTTKILAQACVRESLLDASKTYISKTIKEKLEDLSK